MNYILRKIEKKTYINSFSFFLLKKNIYMLKDVLNYKFFIKNNNINIIKKFLRESGLI